MMKTESLSEEMLYLNLLVQPSAREDLTELDHHDSSTPIHHHSSYDTKLYATILT